MIIKRIFIGIAYCFLFLGLVPVFAGLEIDRINYTGEIVYLINSGDYTIDLYGTLLRADDPAQEMIINGHYDLMPGEICEIPTHGSGSGLYPCHFSFGTNYETVWADTGDTACLYSLNYFSIPSLPNNFRDLITIEESDLSNTLTSDTIFRSLPPKGYDLVDKYSYGNTGSNHCDDFIPYNHSY